MHFLIYNYHLYYKSAIGIICLVGSIHNNVIIGICVRKDAFTTCANDCKLSI